MIDSPREEEPLAKADLILAGFLSFAVVAACFWASSRIDNRIIEGSRLTHNLFDVWFEGDCPRVFNHMTMRVGGEDRTLIHPLFSLAVFPLVKLWRLAGLEPLLAVRSLMSAFAGVWAAGLFALFRLIRRRRFESLLFALIGVSSAASLFWFTVPETWAFGSLSILFALIVTAAARYRRISGWWFVAAQIASGGMAVTNAMVSLAGTFFALGMRRALRVTLAAALIGGGLFAMECVLFRSTQAGLPSYMPQYILSPESHGPIAILDSFLVDSVVMPEVKLIPRSEDPGVKFSTQGAIPGTGSPFAGLALALWTVFLVAGCIGLLRSSEPAEQPFRLTLIASLVGQMAIHLAYGDETFLYALHFIPLLICLATFANRTRLKPAIPALALGLLVSLLASNLSIFLDTTRELPHVITYNVDAEHQRWAAHGAILQNGKLIYP